MKSKTKLDKALVTLTVEPQLAFWAGLSVQIPKVITEIIPTAATDGEKMYFNPKFISTLPNNQVIFLIIHELLHIIRMDSVRVGDRNLKDWNKAADAVINDLAKQMGGKVEPIKSGIYPEGELSALKGQSSEWNYRWFQNNKNKAKEVTSHDILLQNTGIQKDFVEHENKIKRKVQAAIQIANNKNSRDSLSSLPPELKEWIAELISPKIDWRTVLQEFMGNMAKQDWSWSRPNTPILLSTGCIAPTVKKVPSIVNTVVLLDSSGSVSDKQLLQFWDEIAGMSYIVEKLTVAHFTTGINAINTYDFNIDSVEDIIPTERYRGGTSIPNALEDLLEKVDTGEIDYPDIIIILSDMESEIPKQQPLMPVLWVSLGNEGFKAPFGTQINIEPEDTTCLT